MPTHPILINGQWRPAASSESFQAANPATGENLPDHYPISPWSDLDAALSASADAAATLRKTAPGDLAKFLTRYAERIEARAAEITDIANKETALPIAPRLKDIELPRTTNQLRKAAAAAIDGSWSLPTIDPKINIRSVHAPIGPVAIFGPNNFPLAYNAVSGGDFAAAIASGNPVIAKGHPAHPGTTRLLAEEALAAIHESHLPPATLQLIYHTSNDNGTRLVSDPRIGAIGFTGSRPGGMALKRAADAAGKPIYLEMSSLNPVLILPGALRERAEKIAVELADSCLAGTGQFCTKPGLVLLVASDATDNFIAEVKKLFESRSPGTLLTAGVGKSLASSLKTLQSAGAQPLAGGGATQGTPPRFNNSLLSVTAEKFLANPEALQTEAFGNATLLILIPNDSVATTVINHLEGQLTGSLYSDSQGSDDTAYAALEPLLRQRVGRLINDKMPTGVAVTPAMNHGGPYPATGHPGFTAVGIPASLRRFSQLQCYDNVRPNRLPAILQNINPNPNTWRLIDNTWSRENVTV